MSKYAVAKQCIEDALGNGAAAAGGEAEMLEALIVLAIAEFQKRAGARRTADVLRYELSNTGGDVDTVFLRSR